MASEVLLKWNNHCSSFLGLLSSLHKKSRFSDATISCDGEQYHVHRLVLSVCSDYFNSIFDGVDGQHPVIILKDTPKKVLEALLQYMYLGEVNIEQDTFTELITVAKSLKIKGLAVSDKTNPIIADEEKTGASYSSRCVDESVTSDVTVHTLAGERKLQAIPELVSSNGSTPSPLNDSLGNSAVTESLPTSRKGGKARRGRPFSRSGRGSGERSAESCDSENLPPNKRSRLDPFSEVEDDGLLPLGCATGPSRLMEPVKLELPSATSYPQPGDDVLPVVMEVASDPSFPAAQAHPSLHFPLPQAPAQPPLGLEESRCLRSFRRDKDPNPQPARLIDLRHPADASTQAVASPSRPSGNSGSSGLAKLRIIPEERLLASQPKLSGVRVVSEDRLRPPPRRGYCFNEPSISINSDYSNSSSNNNNNPFPAFPVPVIENSYSLHGDQDPSDAFPQHPPFPLLNNRERPSAHRPFSPARCTSTLQSGSSHPYSASTEPGSLRQLEMALQEPNSHTTTSHRFLSASSSSVPPSPLQDVLQPASTTPSLSRGAHSSTVTGASPAKVSSLIKPSFVSLIPLSKNVTSDAKVRGSDDDSFPFSCSKCQLKFKEERAILEHSCSARTDNSELDESKETRFVKLPNAAPFPYHCTKCENRYKELNEIVQHFTVEHCKNETKFYCPLCPYKSRREKNLLRHQRYSCPNRKLRRSESQSKQPAQPALEPQSRPAAAPQSSQQHGIPLEIQQPVIQNDKLMKCPLCDYSSNVTSNVRAHMTRHHGQKKYSCHFCSYSCWFENRLVKHLKNDHIDHAAANRPPISSRLKELVGDDCPPPPVENSCDDGQTVPSKTPSQQIYQCCHCDYYATELYCLAEHSQIHSEPMSKKCPACDYRTSISAHMSRHMSNKKGKLFKCSSCDFTGCHQQSIAHHEKRVSSKNSYASQFRSEVIKKSNVRVSESGDGNESGGDDCTPRGSGGDDCTPLGSGGDDCTPSGSGGDIDPLHGSGEDDGSTSGSGGDVDPLHGSGGDVDPLHGSGGDDGSPSGSGGDVDPLHGSGGDVDPLHGSGGNDGSPYGSGRDVDPLHGSGGDVDPLHGSVGDDGSPCGSGGDVDPPRGPGEDDSLPGRSGGDDSLPGRSGGDDRPQSNLKESEDLLPGFRNEGGRPHGSRDDGASHHGSGKGYESPTHTCSPSSLATYTDGSLNNPEKNRVEELGQAPNSLAFDTATAKRSDYILPEFCNNES